MAERLNLAFPDPANALFAGERIRQAGMQNEMLRRTLERDPERYQRELSASNVALKLEKLKTLASLLRGVNDQATYTNAIETYIRIFPDESGDLKEIPRQYNENYVNQMVQTAITAAERVANMNLTGRQLTEAGRVKAAEIAAAGKKEAADITGKARIKAAEITAGGKEKKLPVEVKWATDFVKKYAPKQLDMTMMLLGVYNPELMRELKESADQVPNDVKPLYNHALSILRQHFGGAEGFKDPLGIR